MNFLSFYRGRVFDALCDVEIVGRGARFHDKNRALRIIRVGLLDPTIWEEGGKSLDTQNNLLDLFNEYFEVVAADTPDRLRECYRLRYEVYYEEGLFPGMNPDDCPDKLEQDEYDRRSKHCLVIYKPKKMIAGTVRLILADQQNPNAKFPLETIAGEFFFQDVVSHANIQRSCVGEISRLILAPEFRTRKGENHRPSGTPDHTKIHFIKNGSDQSNTPQNNLVDYGNTQRRKFPHTVIGLFVGIARLSFESNVTYWYSNMDPSCARFLHSFGIKFMPISPVIDFHGPRQGYFGSFMEIAENVYRSNPQIWALLTNNGLYYP